MNFDSDNFKDNFIGTQIEKIIYSVLPLSAALTEYELYDEQKSYIETITKSCYSILRYQQLTLTYNQLISNPKIDFSFCHINEYINNFYSSIKQIVMHAGHNLLLSATEDMIISSINMNLMSIALANILVNSCINSFQGSDIEIVLSKTEENYFISIKDQGFGMSSDILKKAYDPYFSYNPTNEKDKKLGLGLTLTKEIIKIHDGDIITSSTENVGTTTGIKLPIKKYVNNGEYMFKSPRELIIENSGFSSLSVACSPIYIKRIV